MAFIYNLTDTWNDVTATWNGIKLAVTNSGSSATSNLLNLTVTGASTASFVVDKSGNLVLNGSVNKITMTAPATGATLTLADNSTFATSGAHSSTFTFTGTTTLTFPTSGTVTALGNTTTGSGSIVLATSPTLVTPALGTPSSGILSSCTGYAVGNLTGTGTGVLTALAVNVGSAGAFVTFNGALGTPSSGNLGNCTGYPVSGLGGLGTGVATALAVNVGSAGAFVVNGGALGTPSAATLTNATGLPISTGVSGLGTGVATWLGTPSSANLASAVTDETGSGSLVFGTSPTIGSPTITGTATFNGSTSGTVAFKAPAIAGTTTFTLPSGNGTSGYVLVTDGLGNTSWALSGGAAGNAAGLNTNVQFNDAGSMAGNAAFNFDKVTAALSLGVASTTSATLKLYNSASANAISIASGNSAAWTLTLPTGPGTNGYVLSTDGTGATSWVLGGGVTINTTTITGGTSGRVLYDNAGTVGEKAVTGTGDVVLATSPTLITPALGTPSSGNLSSCTNIPVNQATGTLPVANGGTGLTAGTSGGVLYYSATGTLASSAALAASSIVLGGGAGVAPATTTTGTGVVTAIGNAVNTAGGLLAPAAALTASSIVIGGGSGTGPSTTTTGSGVVTALGVNTGSSGAFVVNGGALGTPTSGTLTNCTGLPATVITGANHFPLGRLTLVSGTPVLNSNQTAKGTIYYTPYIGNLAPIYNGTNFLWVAFSELSVVLDATNAVSGNLYDLFVYNDSGTIRLGYGPAWTNTTTRSGAISQLNGIWTNTSTMTIRYSSSATTSVSANQATYVGTFYATANGQTGMSYFAATAGGGNPTLGLYNAYNRTKVSSQNIDTTANWTYATATFRSANNSNSNRISYVDGLAQTMVWATYTVALSAAGGQTGYMAIGYDSTSNPANSSYGQSNSASVFSFFSMANYNASLGFHFVQALEYSTGATTTYYSGNNGGGLFALLEI